MLAVRNRKKIAIRTRYVVDTQKLFTLEECPVIPTDSGNERYVLEQVQKLAGKETSLVLYDAGLGLLTDSLAVAILDGRPKREGTGNLRPHLLRHGRLARTPRACRQRRPPRRHRTRPPRPACATTSRASPPSPIAPSTTSRARPCSRPWAKRACWSSISANPTPPATPGKASSAPNISPAPLNGTIDRLGADEAMLAVAAGMLGGGANTHQAAYVALAASILEARQMGHHPLDGHALRRISRIPPRTWRIGYCLLSQNRLLVFVRTTPPGNPQGHGVADGHRQLSQRCVHPFELRTVVSYR